MTDLDAIRERHYPALYVTEPPGSEPHCGEDRQPWPCDAAQLIAALDAQPAGLDQANWQPGYSDDFKRGFVVGHREAVRPLRELADAWTGDAEFLEDGDKSHNRPRIVLRKRKASPRELAAETARQCAFQLLAVLNDGEPQP